MPSKSNLFSVRPGYEWLYRRIEHPLHWLVAFGAVATIPVLIAQERGDDRIWVAITDWIVWAIFLVEVSLLTLCAANRGRQLVRSWLGVLVVVLSFPALPDLLASVRLVRVARLVRLLRIVRVLAVTARGMEAMRRSSGGAGLLYVATLSALLTLAGGALMALLEPDSVQDGVWGGLWWAIVTVTTVGYGDIAPQTVGGRMLAVVLMLCGLGLLSTLAGSISAMFVGADEGVELDAMHEQLTRVEAKLDRLLEERERERQP